MVESQEMSEDLTRLEQSLGTGHYAHYVRELIADLETYEQREALTQSEKKAIAQTKKEIELALKSSQNPVDLWSHVNLARAQRAHYIPSSAFPAFVRSERMRDKDILDKDNRVRWEREFDRIIQEVGNDAARVTAAHRESIYRYLLQAGRKWNSFNARMDKLATTLKIIIALLIITGVLALFALRWDTGALISVATGALGGLVSVLLTARDNPLHFRSLRIDLLLLVARPLTGSIVALVLYQFLESGLSPVIIAGWEETSSLAGIAAVSFIAGFSERIVLGRLQMPLTERA